MPAKRVEGNRCCYAGCGVKSSTSRGLSFHHIPAAAVSEAQDNWRRQLIHLARRADPSFNANKAKICSRHFTENCFNPGKFVFISSPLLMNVLSCQVH